MIDAGRSPPPMISKLPLGAAVCASFVAAAPLAGAFFAAVFFAAAFFAAPFFVAFVAGAGVAAPDLRALARGLAPPFPAGGRPGAQRAARATGRERSDRMD